MLPLTRQRLLGALLLVAMATSLDEAASSRLEAFVLAHSTCFESGLDTMACR